MHSIVLYLCMFPIFSSKNSNCFLIVFCRWPRSTYDFRKQKQKTVQNTTKNNTTAKNEALILRINGWKWADWINKIVSQKKIGPNEAELKTNQMHSIEYEIIGLVAVAYCMCKYCWCRNEKPINLPTVPNVGWKFSFVIFPSQWIMTLNISYIYIYISQLNLSILYAISFIVVPFWSIIYVFSFSLFRFWCIAFSFWCWYHNKPHSFSRESKKIVQN